MGGEVGLEGRRDGLRGDRCRSEVVGNNMMEGVMGMEGRR